MAKYNRFVRGILFQSDGIPEQYFYSAFIDIPVLWGTGATFNRTPPVLNINLPVPTLEYFADSLNFSEEPTGDIGTEFYTVMLPPARTVRAFPKIEVTVHDAKKSKKKTGTVTNTAPIDIPFL